MESEDWACVHSRLKVKAFVYDLSGVLLTHVGFLKDYASWLVVWLTRVSHCKHSALAYGYKSKLDLNFMLSQNCHELLFPSANLTIHIGTHYPLLEWKTQSKHAGRLLAYIFSPQHCPQCAFCKRLIGINVVLCLHWLPKNNIGLFGCKIFNYVHVIVLNFGSPSLQLWVYQSVK